ncbi:hypothetical protein PSPO01_07197 [Paraphaeosphaeria sporulosa]
MRTLTKTVRGSQGRRRLFQHGCHAERQPFWQRSDLRFALRYRATLRDGTSRRRLGARLGRIDRCSAGTALQAPRQYLLVVILGRGLRGLNASVHGLPGHTNEGPSAAGSACHCTLCQVVLLRRQISSGGIIRVGMALLRTRRGGFAGRAREVVVPVSGAASHLLETASGNAAG